MMLEATRLKLSAALKAKWASGTRKPNPPETYVKASATHKRQFAEGLRKIPVLTTEDAKRYQTMADPEKVRRANAINGEKRIGIPMPPGPSAATPEHWKSKYWKVKSPEGIIVEGMNLNDLVRMNPHLFDPADLNWKKFRCKATRGLRSLFYIDKRRGEVCSRCWKGWVEV